MISENFQITADLEFINMPFVIDSDYKSLMVDKIQ